jgi:hypothetical protein
VEFETGREVVEHDVRMLGCPSQLLVTRQLPCYSFVVHQHSESYVSDVKIARTYLPFILFTQENHMTIYNQIAPHVCSPFVQVHALRLRCKIGKVYHSYLLYSKEKEKKCKRE